MTYVALTSAHNEEELLRGTLESVLKQSIPPSVYVVVDDGSTDDTPQIIADYPIHCIKPQGGRFHQGYLNKQRAFNLGARFASRMVDWRFMLKVDADSIIPPDYAQKLIEVMNRHPRVGMCSGIWEGGRMWVYRSSNGAILYRRECWDELEGYDPVPAWDTHFILEAYWKGWMSLALRHIRYKEQRSSERENLWEWYKTGMARYLQGFPLIHTIGVGVIHMKKHPPILGGLVMIITHLLFIICKMKKPFSKSYYRFANMFGKMELVLRIRYLLGGMVEYR